MGPSIQSYTNCDLRSIAPFFKELVGGNLTSKHNYDTVLDITTVTEEFSKDIIGIKNKFLEEAILTLTLKVLHSEKPLSLVSFSTEISISEEVSQSSFTTKVPCLNSWNPNQDGWSF